MEKWIYLVLGGAVGTVSRFVMGAAVSQRFGTAFPWGTLAVNLVGCCVIGFLDVFIAKKFPGAHQYRLLLMAGFCGAFTTLSAVMLETSNLLKEGQHGYAAGYMLLTMGLGFAFFKCGTFLAELI